MSPESSTVTVEPNTAVGICPRCGGVSGDDVNLNFPRKATCASCGQVLHRAGVSDQQGGLPFDAAH